MTLKEAAPAEIVLQVLSGDAVEAAHPGLQAAVVGMTFWMWKTPSSTRNPCCTLIGRWVIPASRAKVL